MRIILVLIWTSMVSNLEDLGFIGESVVKLNWGSSDRVVERTGRFVNLSLERMPEGLSRHSLLGIIGQNVLSESTEICSAAVKFLTKVWDLRVEASAYL